MWQEAESGSWNVIFGVGGAERYDVRAGTLPKLVETLTTPSLKDLSNLDECTMRALCTPPPCVSLHSFAAPPLVAGS